MDNVGTGAARDRVVQQLEHWRDELIALSRRNRVLYFKPTKSATLLLEQPSLQTIISRLEQRSGNWFFYEPPEPPEVDPDDPSPPPFRPLEIKPLSDDELLTQKQDRKSIQNSLRLLDRKTTQEFMDRGLWVLYLATGFLEWIDPDDDATVRTPILLLPVRLDRASPRDRYHLTTADEDAVVNPAMLAKLENDFDMKFPSLDDVAEPDPIAYLSQVRDLVEPRGWAVRLEAAIDTFSFHKEVMYRDLLQNADTIVEHELVQALALGAAAPVDLSFDPPSEERLDEDFPPEQTTTIRDADASQRRCMAVAAQGNSFVMDGPPGTGKSQTIANLIAQGLKDGKSILFVSEKIAALEVVKARLDDAGLGEYLLEMHSHKATRKEVAQTLYRSLRMHPRAPKPMSEEAIRTLRQRRRELSEYASAVNEDRKPLGRSIHNAIGRVSQLQDVPSAPLPSRVNDQLSADEFVSIMDAARALERAWGPVARADEFFWHGLKLAHTSMAEKRKLADTLDELKEALGSLESESESVASSLELWWHDAPRRSYRLLEVLEALEDRVSVPDRWLSMEDFGRVPRHVDHLEDAWKRRDWVIAELEDLAGPAWKPIPRAFAEQIPHALDNLEQLDPSWKPPGQTQTLELERLSDFITRSIKQIHRLDSVARGLATSLGLEARDLTLERAQTLSAVADLIGVVNPPEEEWLDPLALSKLEEAQTVLQTLVSASRRKAEELNTIFKPEIVELDLETLRVRFDELHRGLRKLGGAYRADKRQLAAATRTGKVTKETLAALPDAIEWKNLKAELADAETRHSGTLGDHYYQGERTDFTDISEAIEVARQALELAGQQLSDQDRFRHQLARTGTPDASLKQAASEIAELSESWQRECRERLGDFADKLLAMDLSALARWFEQTETPVGTLSAMASHVATTIHSETSIDALFEICTKRSRIEDLEDALSSTWQSDRDLLGEGYQAMDTDWSALRDAVGWAEGIRDLLGDPADPVTAQRLLSVETSPSALRQRIEAWTATRNRLTDAFDSPRSERLLKDLDANYDDARQVIGELAGSIGDIDEWAAHSRAVADLIDHGMGEVVQFLESESVTTDQVALTVERAVLEAWIDTHLSTDPRLKTLRSTDRDALVEEFRKLDKELIDAMSSQVISQCNSRRPTTRIGASGIIEREGQKKRRHMPVRMLIEQTSEVVQSLKPCFMMSPLSVSQFLTPDVTFDLVIFDEASQVKPADAVNCIYRGRQLIVAGDQKQLPPTSFFDRVMMDESEEYTEEAIDEFESVLDLSKAGGLPSLPLRWHYRSQHEHLITYSNYSFYEGRLVTFPGAQQEGDDIGLELYKVDGEYRRGGSRDNPVEAEKVADRVLFHVQSHPDLTLGVVAFSDAQAQTIEYVLDQRRRGFPELDEYFTEDRLSGFFVKNLESVQGDERDIMIFSIGYGPDEVGKITMNFGPLNKSGGERRLNVAITRARRRVEVVTSILPEDFSSTSSVGPRHLKRYLEFARSGMSALAVDVESGSGDVESPFEAEVLQVVRSWGFDAVPQVGVADYRIDLGVVDPDAPGRYVLGIECDGAMYHSSPVARDRDRLRQEVLEGLGWRFHRIWGPAWYRDRTGEEARLHDAIIQALDGGNEPVRQRTNSGDSRSQPELHEVDLDALPAWAEEYVVSKPRVVPRDEFHAPGSLAQIEDAIIQVVSNEAPISRDLLLQRVRLAWGLQRAGGRVRDAFESGLSRAKRSGRVKVDRYGFVWRSNQSLKSVRTPTEDPDSERSVSDLPREELRLAVLKLVEDARVVDWDELTVSVARLFGWSRRGTEIASALDTAVRYLIKSGDLIRQGDRLSPGM